MKKFDKIAIISGAGPAGLTAAYELLKINIKPIILEKDSQVGGISKTVNRDDWLFDIGSHRFFTKSPAVAKLWEEVLPVAPEKMLVVNRLSRIYYNKKLFNYPVTLSFQTLKSLGFLKSLKIFFSYLRAKISPIKNEESLEDFFINRFGRELYQTFFKNYTEKVWGIPCQEIPKDWGAQRVKGLSLSKVITSSLKSMFKVKDQSKETSLIDSFFFPSYGAGQIYEEMAKRVIDQGGEIIFNTTVKDYHSDSVKVKSVTAFNSLTQETSTYSGDYFFSSQPISSLTAGFENMPADLRKIGAELSYRSLILVPLVYDKLLLSSKHQSINTPGLIADNWLYIQEDGVKMGRISIFNNFSPKMLKDPNKVLIATEFFCDEDDEFWLTAEDKIISLAKRELAEMGIANDSDFRTGFVWKQEKAYPSYFGSYRELDKIKNYLNNFDNLFLIGRNGQHRYNNMDHSILSAITAVGNIKNNIKDKSNVWNVNTESEYHEEKTT
ncbi:MAG: NAD(P)/FAD-dependent oxidoreductase [Patescibacteria group bacterium]|jgi:protoporphyrinogen oxidase